jgi:hydrogenase expression/formation protein HypE
MNDSQAKMQNQPMRIKAVLFHLESTLIEAEDSHAPTIKASIGCPAETGALDFIRSLPDDDARTRARSELERLELKAAANSKPAPGAPEIVRYLKLKKLRLAIISNGSRSLAEKTLACLPEVNASDFNPVISGDEILAKNPDTNMVQFAARQMDLPPEQVLVVTGEASIQQAGQKAGAVTVFVTRPAAAETVAVARPFQISGLDALKPIVRLGIPLPAGKLPNDLLREFLNQFVFDDPSILINPGIGEDTAAVNVTAEEVLVLKSDPITFATDSIGQYAVLINANDIATSGAKPRWLLTTLLFPCGVTPSEIRQVIDELKEYCRRWEITLCGGHTEITDAVARPVVTGMMAGTVARRNLIDKRRMAQGDRVLLTKGVAVEGTAIIAREFGDRLTEMGLAESEIERCRQFLTNISILKEAQIAAKSRDTTAMHDITEGGLATAAEELSIAGGHRIKIDMDAIPVFEETQKICRLLDIQPLGLIGSGSLLICCRQAGCQRLINKIRKGGIEVTCIGEVQEKGQGVCAVKHGKPTAWPNFEVDEIARLF